jgi:hypothetical protein
MNITVEYSKRQYGIGDTVRHYAVTVREVDGLYIEDPAAKSPNYYESRELEIQFRAAQPAAGRGFEHHWSDAEVIGGRLELSHDAARQLAQSLLQFLDNRSQAGAPQPIKFEISEKPEPRTRTQSGL